MKLARSKPAAALVVVVLCVLLFRSKDALRERFDATLHALETQYTPLEASLVLSTLTATCSLIPFCPTTPINLTAGVILGAVSGGLCTAVGCALGAAIAFVLGRTLLRSYATAKIAGDDGLRRIDAALKRKGGLIVFLLRLSPVFPFGILSFVFGTSGVTHVEHFFGSLLGLIPSCILYAKFGSDAKALSDDESGDAESKSSIGSALLSMVLSIGSVLLISYFAKRVLDREMNALPNKLAGIGGGSAAAASKARAKSKMSIAKNATLAVEGRTDEDDEGEAAVEEEDERIVEGTVVDAKTATAAAMLISAKSPAANSPTKRKKEKAGIKKP